MTVFWKGCISKTLRAMNKSEAGCGPRLLTSTQAQEWLLRIRPMFLPELSPDWSADMEGGPRVFPETARKSDDIHRILKRLGAKKRVRALKRPKMDIRLQGATEAKAGFRSVSPSIERSINQWAHSVMN